MLSHGRDVEPSAEAAIRRACCSNRGKARQRPEPAKAFYVGDTVDDARCARAAGVPFIGIAAPSNPLYLDLVFLFQAEGAYAIVDDINYLEEVLRVMRNAAIRRDTKETRIAGGSASRAAAATRSRPASVSSTTCWSCSPNTAAST